MLANPADLIRDCGYHTGKRVGVGDVMRPPTSSRSRQQVSEKRALMAMAESATMRVQVSETASAGDLKAYLEEARCVVQVLDPHTLAVSIPRAPSRAQACAS